MCHSPHFFSGWDHPQEATKHSPKAVRKLIEGERGQWGRRAEGERGSGGEGKGWNLLNQKQHKR